MTARQPLLDSLRRAHLRLGLAAVVAAGLTLTLLSFLTLRSQVEHNLMLVARSISYTAEAAAVFGDAQAAQEVLAPIAAREGLRAARIHDGQGRLLAQVETRSARAVDAGLADLATLLFAPRAQAPIVHQSQLHGQVVIHGDGVVYLVFLAKVLAGVALCTAVIGWSVSRLSRRISRDIVEPLNRLATLTRTARSSRDLALRAPPAAVKEIHELGEDFNALLAEIESREARLVASHDTLRSANESLSYLAFHDSLTGLPNRAAFLERAARAMQALRGGTDRLAVLYLDCDRFKAINDALGHAAGDEWLVAVAQRLRALLRETDLVARIGGDEFAVLLWPVHGADEARRIAAALAQALRAPLHSAAFGPLASSVSIGVALAPDHAGDVEALLGAADAAMYRAKSHAPGSFAVFDAALDEVSPPLVA